MLKIGFISFLLAYAINGETQLQMANLHNVLMSDYKSDVVPRNNDDPINVSIAFYLSLVTRKPVFGVCDQVRLKPACLADETR